MPDPTNPTSPQVVVNLNPLPAESIEELEQRVTDLEQASHTTPCPTLQDHEQRITALEQASPTPTPTPTEEEDPVAMPYINEVVLPLIDLIVYAHGGSDTDTSTMQRPAILRGDPSLMTSTKTPRVIAYLNRTLYDNAPAGYNGGTYIN